MKQIKDFFNLEYGKDKCFNKNSLDPNSKIPLISSKGKNMGIFGYINAKPTYENVINVPRTGTICYACYQGNPCCINDDNIVLIPKEKLNLNELIYFVLLIRKETYRYSYGRKVTPKRLAEAEVPEIPKWIYKINISIHNLTGKMSNKPLNLNDRKWKLFDYPEVFILDKGYNNVSPKKEGNFPFISATRENNGVSFWCDKEELTKTFEGNCLIVVNDGASMGETFYQPEGMDFGASHSINIIRLKERVLNPYIAMFLIPLIKREKIKFHYGRKWRIERMAKSTIKLPINENNEPDWNFMENYIKGLSYSKEL